MKLAVRRTTTGKENSELPLLQRKRSLELPASDIAAQMLHGVQVTDTSQHQLFRGDCVNQSMVELLQQQKTLLKDTNKKHEEWTLHRWKSVLWSKSKFEIFVSNCRVFVRRRVGERITSACVVPTVKHGRGVMVWV
jgi:hypothetical protein